jgi:hypothetical protein
MDEEYDNILTKTNIVQASERGSAEHGTRRQALAAAGIETYQRMQKDLIMHVKRPSMR